MKVMLMVAAVAAAFVASAQGPMPPKGGRPSGPMGGANRIAAIEPVMRMALNPKTADQIGVSAEQTAKLKELNAQNRAAMKGLPEKVRLARAQQAKALAADKVDEKVLMAAFEDEWAARKAVAALQMKLLLGVRGILTVDQIDTARKVMREAHARTAQTRRGFRGERRPQPPEARHGGKDEGEKDAPPPPPPSAEKPAEAKK